MRDTPPIFSASSFFQAQISLCSAAFGLVLFDIEERGRNHQQNDLYKELLVGYGVFYLRVVYLLVVLIEALKEGLED